MSEVRPIGDNVLRGFFDRLAQGEYKLVRINWGVIYPDRTEIDLSDKPVATPVINVEIGDPGLWDNPEGEPAPLPTDQAQRKLCEGCVFNRSRRCYVRQKPESPIDLLTVGVKSGGDDHLISEPGLAGATEAAGEWGEEDAYEPDDVGGSGLPSNITFLFAAASTGQAPVTCEYTGYKATVASSS